MFQTPRRRRTAVALPVACDAFPARWLAVLTFFAALIAASGLAHARSAPESFADLAEHLLPTVVNIASTQSVQGRSSDQMEEFFKKFFEQHQGVPPPEQRPTSALGSGFIIDSSGYIVTNRHVIEGADEITVRLHDDTLLKATLVGSDEKTDLALLKVEADKPLPAAKWGNSEKTRIGDWVVAIGNPFGLGGTVTAGIVSARQRDINSGPYDEYIQTDAAINRGNSGGPMFNVDGEVIGVNTAIFSPSGGSIGIGFAIPSSLAHNVIDQLRQYGEVRRGWLGVRIQTVTDELAEGMHLKKAHGALVAAVTEGGPAEKAGIEQGDVILEFDGRSVDEMRRLPKMVAETAIGKAVGVVVWRKGKTKTFQVELGELPEEPQVAAVPPQDETAAPESGQLSDLGLTVQRLTPELRQQFELGEKADGVVITEVQPGGSGAEKGLQAGDVIVEVDQEQVKTPSDVASRVQKAIDEGYRVVTLLVYRQGEFQWVAVRIGKD